MNLKNYESNKLNSEIQLNETSIAQTRTDSSPSVSSSELFFRLVVLALALLCLAASSARACGPSFPNNLLELGDHAVLVAPVAHFRQELERMQLISSRFTAVYATNGYAEQARDTDVADLVLALKKRKTSSENSELIVNAYREAREKLRGFTEDYDRWANSGLWVSDEHGGHYGDPATPPPKFPQITMPTNLPGEFADYFEGAVAWRNPADKNKSIARAAWKRLLERPATERKYKSTWAAFMLGKSLEESDPEKASAYFQQVRQLVSQGFVDSAGLATASLGLEARVSYAKDNYSDAIELYLEQFAAGDDSAVVSLQRVAESALVSSEALPKLAANPHAQKVITAFLISDRSAWASQSEPNEAPSEIATAWLQAVETAGINDVDSAEKLALAAYRAGMFDVAQRWINRAKTSPVAQWIQAKLYLRAGKVPQAAALLAKVAAQLPVVETEPDAKPTDFVDNLVAQFAVSDFDEFPARRQVLGELGVLRLNRREFALALDALLNAGYWTDAAYIAERVLTANELKDYVDRFWPETNLSAQMNPQEPPKSLVEQNRQNIRYLLARRLTRELRGNEARSYYPAEWRPHFDNLVRDLIAGWNTALPSDQRAKALFSAAFIARTNGMELLGTEVQPDWHVWEGSFEQGVTWESRATNEIAAKINVATSAEIQRASQHTTDPEQRFHYRYQAAVLGWEAAKLMTNNCDDTAFVLWTAGSWLKDRDPITADLFYKSLVRRCRNTALGAEADYLRWFPTLDSTGQFLSRERPLITAFNHEAPDEIVAEEPAEEPIEDVLTDLKSELEAQAELENTVDGDTTEETEAEVPTLPVSHGYEYTVESGDTVIAIVRAFNRAGINISVDDVLDANPGLEPTKMATSSKIFIPAEPQHEFIQ